MRKVALSLPQTAPPAKYNHLALKGYVEGNHQTVPAGAMIARQDEKWESAVKILRRYEGSLVEQ